MQKKLTAVALAGAVALGGAAAIAVPAFADTSSSTEATPRASRVDAIKDALKGLVGDKTLTQDQADKVAETLGQQGALGGHGPGGGYGPGGGFGGMRPGPGMGMAETMKAEAEAAAKVLGLSVDDLRTALRGGSTLADLAKKQGKSEDALVNALVAVAKTRLDDAVKAKRITQDRADEIEKNLPAQVKAIVENGGRGGFGPGMGRRHDGWGRGQRPEGAPGTPGTPGQSSPSPSATGSTSGTTTNWTPARAGSSI